MRGADRHAEAYEVSWLQGVVLIGKHATYPKGAGPWRDLVVLKVDLSLVSKALLILQAEVHRHPGAILAESGLPFARHLSLAQHGCVIHVKVGVDRACGDNCRQDGLVLGDQV